MRNNFVSNILINQTGSAMVKVIVLGAAVMAFSKYGLEMVTKLAKDEKRNNTSIETSRSFDLIQKYLSIKPICDKYANIFVNEDIDDTSKKNFTELTTINSLGLDGRAFAKLSYDGETLTSKPYEAKILSISISRPSFKKSFIRSINSQIELIMNYGECFKPNGHCTKNELKVKTLSYKIPITGRYRKSGGKGIFNRGGKRTIRYTYCNIPLSDQQKESLAKSCEAVGGKIDYADYKCKFPVYDPCSTHRDGASPNVTNFENCMVPYVGTTIDESKIQYVSFQEAVCKLDRITANNSARAENYNPAIMAKDPQTGQTYVAEDPNTGNTWLVTTKYCEDFKAWTK